MATCYREETVTLRAVTGRPYKSAELARKGGEALIDEQLESLVKCDGDCGDNEACKLTIDIAERDALSRIFSYNDDDGAKAYGFRIREGSKLTVICDCVPSKKPKKKK